MQRCLHHFCCCRIHCRIVFGNRLSISEENSTARIEWSRLCLAGSFAGIGPGLAGRIVRYRDRLGGYHTLEQLKEVWGVDDSLYSFIVRRLTVDESGLHRKLYLNTDSLERFGRHPYLGWKLGRILINYRKQHGPYQHVEELLKPG